MILNTQSPLSTLHSPTADSLPLHLLPPGSCATIVRIGGAAALRRRCMEMGIVRGELIRTERIAPLGDPIAYRVKGYTLSLRREDAARIEVIPTGCHEGEPCAVDAAHCPLDEETPLPGGVQKPAGLQRSSAPLPEGEQR